MTQLKRYSYSISDNAYKVSLLLEHIRAGTCAGN